MDNQTAISRVRTTTLLCAGLFLVGCATESMRAPAVEQDRYLRSLYADARLDPIRDKVPLLLRPDAIKPSHLANETKPTPAEKSAISAWLQVRERAQQYQTAKNREPSPLLAQTRKQVTGAILQLHAGKLSYAGFARRIQQIDQDHQAIARQNAGAKTDTSTRE